MKKWLADLPTTALLVATGVFMAIGTALRYWVSSSWTPSDGWLMFICGFAAGSTGHFAVKRFSDIDYKKAKLTDSAGKDIQ